MQMVRNLFMAVFISALLTSCGSLGLVENIKPSTPAQYVLAAETDYYAVFHIMAEYESLPRCDNENAPDLCSNQSVVDTMRILDNRFIEARNIAWDVVRAVNPDATVFQNVLIVLTSIVDDAVRITTNLKNEGLI